VDKKTWIVAINKDINVTNLSDMTLDRAKSGARPNTASTEEFGFKVVFVNCPCFFSPSGAITVKQCHRGKIKNIECMEYRDCRYK